MMFLEFFVWGAWYVSMTGFITRIGHERPHRGGVFGRPAGGDHRAVFSRHDRGSVFFDRAGAERAAFVGRSVLDRGPIRGPTVRAAASACRFEPVLSSWCFTICRRTRSRSRSACSPTCSATCRRSGSRRRFRFTILENQERDFPLVRVLGTIGWIVGNIAVGSLPDADQVAGAILSRRRRGDLARPLQSDAAAHAAAEQGQADVVRPDSRHRFVPVVPQSVVYGVHHLLILDLHSACRLLPASAELRRKLGAADSSIAPPRR